MIRASMLGMALLILSLFGMYTGVPSRTHHGHCPYVPVADSACATLVSHLEHWQGSTLGVIAGALLLLAILIALNSLVALYRLLLVRNQQMQDRENIRPPLLVELFARGLLNPSVP